MENIVAKRRLGEGRWDRALKRKMTELSVADNYDEAKHEWLATGNVWWSGNDVMPDWVRNSQMGVGKCLCGHIVVYHFEIRNTENGTVECVGSDHINSYLIMRAIAEDEGVNIDTITDEQIQEWISVRTKSMKAEAWWKSNGEAFTMMFDSIKELDLHFNIHKRDWYYDRDTQQNHRRRVLRKRGEGSYGSPNYKMASLVWRWNHPDNPKAQINTTGFPNDNLMKDLALFYIKREQYQNQLDKYNQTRANRIEALRIALEERRRQQEERQRRYREQEAERQRIYNLPENVEARRIEAEEAEEQRRLWREQQEADRIAREIAQRQKQEEILTKDFGGDHFLQVCDYYGVPEFDESFAGNEWERSFLADIKEQMMGSRELSQRQLHTLKRIFDVDLATPKQLGFLENLGYNGTVSALTKREASNIISQLLEERN
jgi:hypothetical protein